MLAGMKIEVDHQELQTILEHVRQTKSADTAILQSLIQTMGPTILESLRPRTPPQVVPDPTGTDD